MTKREIRIQMNMPIYVFDKNHPKVTLCWTILNIDQTKSSPHVNHESLKTDPIK
jgi:hypothetical protein